MSLKSLLNDDDKVVPLELVWAKLDANRKRKALRMLEQGDLISQGRLLLMDDNPNRPGLGDIEFISRERWLDSNRELFEKLERTEGKLKLTGFHSDDEMCDIYLHNSEELRELLEFEQPKISIDEYDERFFQSTNNKMGARVWAHAAAALASNEIDPTSRKLAAHLLSLDIWPGEPLSERRLQQNLSPLISEFKKLSGLE